MLASRTITEMGKHKEWRKIAKRERRRRIRTQLAKDRDDIHYNEEYLKEQQILHTIELEMIERTNAEENEKWLCAERRAMEQWQVLEKKKKILYQERLEREAKLKIEWEMEQKKKKAEEERMKAIEEENRLKQETFMKNLEEFLSGDSTDPPRELLISRETRPHAAICPFFSKTGCCRFGDQCSRNHQHPGISKILLATNFFVHFGMDNATPSEYDTDIMLEYEEIETYKQFKEFFFDVLEEFKKFGKVVIFKVCNNMEKHLRGNVYVEYAELRCAVAAYRSLHARWYGGRQLSLQFTLVTSWKNAICGLQFSRCPKGRACNFLHVFKNPNKLFMRYDTGERDTGRSPSRSWRWSESPEPDIPRRPRKQERERRKHHEGHRSHDRRHDDDDRKHRDYDRKYRNDDGKSDNDRKQRDSDRKHRNDSSDRKELDDGNNDDDRKHRNDNSDRKKFDDGKSDDYRKHRDYDRKHSNDNDDTKELDDGKSADDRKLRVYDRKHCNDNDDGKELNDGKSDNDRKLRVHDRKHHNDNDDGKELDGKSDDRKHDDDSRRRHRSKKSRSNSNKRI